MVYKIMVSQNESNINYKHCYEYKNIKFIPNIPIPIGLQKPAK